MPLAVRLFTEDQRRADRMNLGVATTVRDVQQPADATLIDLSARGCLLETNRELTAGTAIVVAIGGIGRVEARIVRREGNRYGCTFEVPIARPTRDAALASGVVVAFPDTFRVHSTPVSDARWPAAARLLFLALAAGAAWVPILVLALLV